MTCYSSFITSHLSQSCIIDTSSCGGAAVSRGIAIEEAGGAAAPGLRPSGGPLREEQKKNHTPVVK